MAKAIKQHGRVYTPDYIVKQILDFGGYDGPIILKKHVIDNSCGDGAFLKDIVQRYCSIFLSINDDLAELKKELETFIHGIELDSDECVSCIQNLDCIVLEFGILGVKWDVLNSDTLTIDKYNGKMDYVFGNPPYVRVHNLDCSYNAVKKFSFAEKGMTDLFIVFFEIGFNMLNKNGVMSLITPSSWLSSNAGHNLRNYILHNRNLSGVIDLGHFQPFEAATYTIISRFQKSYLSNVVEYNILNAGTLEKEFISYLTLDEMYIANSFYLAKSEYLTQLRAIKTDYSYSYVTVKNGFATLADKIFIGDFDFSEGTIDILKASTGKWSKCIFPYDKTGKPLSLEKFSQYSSAYKHLLQNSRKLKNGRDIDGDKFWYLFGRTQALRDVSKKKYAINTIIRDKDSIKLEVVPEGNGVYSGLYILTEIGFDEIKQLLCSEDFINYIKSLKNYKSGGYFTYASKDLEHYLNYKLSKQYGQSRISNSGKRLF